ncbi:hypothetical protein [Planotetraspora sp. GP83]|uniref:hypothetical protein n=1 Tax=Planotetraspora sp. GP83 TaxID=3156264 RepID=UPI003513737B
MRTRCRESPGSTATSRPLPSLPGRTRRASKPLRETLAPDFETTRFQAGPRTELHNCYPELYEASTVKVLRELYGNDYVTLFRAGYTASPSILHGFWGADAGTNFEGLRLSLRRV